MSFDFIHCEIQNIKNLTRLNALGFLSTEDDILPGNFAMFDQQRAFDWIQTNIEKFGGDPTKVTIHGQSGTGFRINTSEKTSHTCSF